MRGVWEWVRWHVTELSAVALTAAAAVWVSPWWAVVTVAVVGCWVRAELAVAVPKPTRVGEQDVMTADDAPITRDEAS